MLLVLKDIIIERFERNWKPRPRKENMTGENNSKDMKTMKNVKRNKTEGS